ncbi:VOC family protein [Jiangella alkaliphila]|uniref:Glyoxalase-like domain-containing protein n=1 Tax=Jiangella alkaliphila TaxID=419479 RepID=A0A1H2J264_9ACTN|nr:VOC family protein [Jiangella alkaliphila]SDU50557.1 Glyoxalase-like domain-containing protein [Jiangella alkaliphila]
MRLAGGYPVVITERLRECRDFYVGRLGFAVVFEADWFVLLDGGGVAVAFMLPEHPSAPPSPGPHTGDGAFLTLQVTDAAAEYATLLAAGVEIALPLTDEPWGQRRFGLVDPAGQWVDVVEQIQPEPGWWDPYIG